jgi:UDP-glucose 4-epimerase
MSVVATDDLSGGYRENVPTHATWVQRDLRDSEFVASLWSQGPFDFVYHLGAYAAEGLSHFLVDRRLRPQSGPDERGDGPQA